MDHVLDNPAWYALTLGNEIFLNGNGSVKYFAKEVSPFVALKEYSAENFEALHGLVPPGSFSLLITLNEMEIPSPWKVTNCIKGLQMVYSNPANTPETVGELAALTEKDVPQMLALTKLTNPGPFASRTIDFGHYHGIFEGDQLVAMAGQRLHPLPYAEISAVCTHPDHTGKGYARQLLLHQIHRIKAATNIPFLHVRHDNERAIKVYEDLGFVTRRGIYFYVMQQTDPDQKF
jgi:ribosomal protein S18 acetylase RimI-like enzyme